MSDYKLHTPNGVNDILPAERTQKRRIEGAICAVFEAAAYKEVETPMFEYYDCYFGRDGQISQENLYKFFDEQGRVLALRPDFTTSIARMAATKEYDKPLPLRYMYSGSVFRTEQTEGARRREFTQSGIELIGSYSPRADAEVVALTIDALIACGIEKMSIEIGQVGFFNGLVEQTGLLAKDAESLRERIDSKDVVGVREILSDIDMDTGIKKLITELPYLFGGAEILDKADLDGLNAASKNALDNLRTIYGMLSDMGYKDYVSLDLGMLRDIDYYTGIIFKGYTHGIGFPICAGGRYDNLMSNFGASMGAVGAAIGVNRVMSALSEAKSNEQKAPVPYANNKDLQQTGKAAALSGGGMRYLTVALAKGRLAELAMDIFSSIGMDCEQMKEKTRKLIFTDEKNKMKFILVKASDVPTYVEYGAADIGIVGKDTLLEEGRNLYEMVDLGFGKCRMCVCGPKHLMGKLDKIKELKVASKYTETANRYFRDVKGQTVDIIKLHGSVELAPLVGLSDVIVDIVETGKTLHENGLDVLETVCELSARLVVNKVSMKMERDRIMNIVDRFASIDKE